MNEAQTLLLTPNLSDVRAWPRRRRRGGVVVLCVGKTSVRAGSRGRRILRVRQCARQRFAARL